MIADPEASREKAENTVWRRLLTAAQPARSVGCLGCIRNGSSCWHCCCRFTRVVTWQGSAARRALQHFAAQPCHLLGGAGEDWQRAVGTVSTHSAQLSQSCGSNIEFWCAFAFVSPGVNEVSLWVGSKGPIRPFRAALVQCMAWAGLDLAWVQGGPTLCFVHVSILCAQGWPCLMSVPAAYDRHRQRGQVYAAAPLHGVLRCWCSVGCIH